MAASSLLKQVAAPTKQEVQDTLGGVLCRCTGYQKIVEAVMAAAEGLAQDAPLTDAPFTDPGAGAAVGACLVKTDGPAKVTGRELYRADKAPAGALWLRVIPPPHARTRLTQGALDAGGGNTQDAKRPVVAQ